MASCRERFSGIGCLRCNRVLCSIDEFSLELSNSLKVETDVLLRAKPLSGVLDEIELVLLSICVDNLVGVVQVVPEDFLEHASLDDVRRFAEAACGRGDASDTATKLA